MAKRQARALAAIAVLGALYTLGPIPVSAETIFAEPDNFAVGTVIDNAIPGVTLSVEGAPVKSVQVLDGFSVFNGANLATTGTSVFGQLPLHSSAVPQGWDATRGMLRADFDQPTDFVQIDIIFDDNDFGRLQAFDSSGSLLDTVLVSGDGRGPTPFVTASITRTSKDIAYILAGGDLEEALFLDNLQFNFVSPVNTLLVAGPLRDDGDGNLVPFDVNNDGFTNSDDEGNLIGVGLSHAQYFAYEIEIENYAPDNSLDGLAFLDVLPDGFRLSADAEAALTACTGNDCDGVVEDASGDCIVTVSGPKAKKNTIVPRYVAIETDGLAASTTCTTMLYVETTSDGAGKGKKEGSFEPDACEVADTIGNPLNNTIALNDGVKMFDAATPTNDLLLGPVGSIQLAPQGCP